MNIEELASKHALDYPGYKLADFYEAAFPSYAIQLQVLMQVKRPLPVLEEFILKTADAGMTTVADIAGVLGLEHSTVEAGLDQLQRRDYLYFKASSEISKSIPILITNKGRSALKELFMSEPEPSNYSVCMDALTGLLYKSQPLAQPKDIRELEIHPIPTYIPTPKLEQIHFLSLKRLVAEAQRDLPPLADKRELVDILEIEKSWTAYRRMRILQYVRESDGAVLVQVFDRGDRSIEHEAALINMESKMLRPLRAVKQSDVPQMGPSELSVINAKSVEAARQISLEKPKITQEIATKNQILEQTKNLQSSELAQDRREATFHIDELNQQIASLEARLKEMEAQAETTEVLQMYEHRPKLIEALRVAKSQVIIVSPWLNSDAVDYELRQEIAKTLQKGVSISIAYGFGEETPAEKKTVQKLKDLAEKKKGQLKLYRVGDLHSKVLICDHEFMVLTSFNWLSFAGDPMRGARIEDGMLTRDKNAIAEKIQEWTARMTGSFIPKQSEKGVKHLITKQADTAAESRSPNIERIPMNTLHEVTHFDLSTEVDRLEIRMRDFIHDRLISMGDNMYWKKCIPPDVVEFVKKHIEEHLERHPYEDKTKFSSGRVKLDFCDVSHYEKIILTNWKMFEDNFKKRMNFQIYMASFRELRNAVQHNRTPNEIQQKNGEAAILWFTGILDNYDRSLTKKPEKSTIN